MASHQRAQQLQWERQQQRVVENSYEEVITTTTETRQSLEYHTVMDTADKGTYYMSGPFAGHHQASSSGHVHGEYPGRGSGSESLSQL